MPPLSKETNRQSVKKFYDANANEILKNKVIKRILSGKVPQKRSLDKFEITNDMVNEMRQEAGLEPIKIKDPRKRKPKVKAVPKVSLEHIKNTYDKLVDDEKISKITGHNHYSNFAQILKSIDCENTDDVSKCFLDDKVYDYLNRDGLNPNTSATYAMNVLNVIDTNEILKEQVGDEMYSKIKELFEKLKKAKDEYNIDKRLNDDIVPFKELKKRIETENGMDSQESLMINLYDNITPRNDFDTLTFDTNDPNHIDMEKGTITISDFGKTNKKYDPIKDYKLSKTFMTMLKKSVKADPRQKVFTKKMRSIFKKAKTGVNEIRHSKISTELKGSKIKDKDKREELRTKMFHSSATQLTYIRSLKN